MVNGRFAHGVDVQPLIAGSEEHEGPCAISTVLGQGEDRRGHGARRVVVAPAVVHHVRPVHARVVEHLDAVVIGKPVPLEEDPAARADPGDAQTIVPQSRGHPRDGGAVIIAPFGRRIRVTIQVVTHSRSQLPPVHEIGMAEIEAIVCVARDITERRKAEQELQAAKQIVMHTDWLPALKRMPPPPEPRHMAVSRMVILLPLTM